MAVTDKEVRILVDGNFSNTSSCPGDPPCNNRGVCKEVLDPNAPSQPPNSTTPLPSSKRCVCDADYRCVIKYFSLCSVCFHSIFSPFSVYFQCEDFAILYTDIDAVCDADYSGCSCKGGCKVYKNRY